MANRGKIYSATPLSEKQLADITAYFCRLLGDDSVHLRPDIDERLLGGFVVHIGGVAYDASLRARLEELREHMMEDTQ